MVQVLLYAVAHPQACIDLICSGVPQITLTLPYSNIGQTIDFYNCNSIYIYIYIYIDSFK